MHGAQSGYRTQGNAVLSLVGARYCDSQAGRFITRDTVLDQKPYLYCEHDPVNYVDPSGHDFLGIGAWWNRHPLARGVITGTVFLIALPILLPAAAGTLLGSALIGAVAGFAGSIAAGGDKKAIKSGGLYGAVGGAVTGTTLAPWWKPIHSLR